MGLSSCKLLFSLFLLLINLYFCAYGAPFKEQNEVSCNDDKSSLRTEIGDSNYKIYKGPYRESYPIRPNLFIPKTYPKYLELSAFPTLKLDNESKQVLSRYKNILTLIELQLDRLTFNVQQLQALIAYHGWNSDDAHKRYDVTVSRTVMSLIETRSKMERKYKNYKSLAYAYAESSQKAMKEQEQNNEAMFQTSVNKWKMCDIIENTVLSIYIFGLLDYELMALRDSYYIPKTERRTSCLFNLFRNKYHRYSILYWVGREMQYKIHGGDFSHFYPNFERWLDKIYQVKISTRNAIHGYLAKF